MAAGAGTAIAGLALTSLAFAAPAVDEYSSRLPDASGEANLGPTTPEGQPEELPAAVRKQLEGSPDGETLALIATADELRAPQPAQAQLEEESADGRGVLTAALSALADPIGIAILLGLVAIVGTALLLRSRGANRDATRAGSG